MKFYKLITESNEKRYFLEFKNTSIIFYASEHLIVLSNSTDYRYSSIQKRSFYIKALNEISKTEFTLGLLLDQNFEFLNLDENITILDFKEALDTLSIFVNTNNLILSFIIFSKVFFVICLLQIKLILVVTRMSALAVRRHCRCK